MDYYRKIGNQISWVYVIKIADFSIMLALFAILTRFLSKDDFGLYSLLNVSILLLTGILSLGLPDFIVRTFTGKKEDEKRQAFRQVFCLSCIISLISTIVLLFLTYFVLEALKLSTIFLATSLVILCSGFIVIGSIVEAYIYSEKNTVKSKLLSVSLRSFWALPVIILALSDAIGLNMIFATRLIFTILVLICVFTYLRSMNFKFIQKIDWSYAKKALLFGIPLATLVVSQWAITATDRYMLGWFHSAASVGNYSFVYTLLDFIFVFSTSAISLVLYPYIVEEYNHGKKERSNFLMNSMLKYILILAVPALAGFYILSKEITTMVSGQGYLPALVILPYLIIFPLLKSITTVFTYALTLKNMTKIIAFLYGGGIVLNIILNMLLIPAYGITGAGIATTVTYIAMAAFFMQIGSRHVALDYAYLGIGKILLSTAIMALPLLFIHPYNVFSKIATIILGAAVYVACLLLLKAFREDEITLIKNLVLRK
ncbi:oligosaccharide flippase family protein [Candidatus Woesearchaeota archaeon]|nr:oligosaccharide flippase family protein [Candidatus Woesearchaeota archaeon]